VTSTPDNPSPDSTEESDASTTSGSEQQSSPSIGGSDRETRAGLGEEEAVRAESGGEASPQPASGTDGDGSTEVPAYGEAEEGDLVGSVLSERYRLDAYIGGGGMGEVYRGEHVMMKKTVAVKVLRSEVADREKLVERFRREAQAAGNLDHPNICSATDFGRADDGSFYLVMEYVEGQNLADLLARRGALEFDRALEVADQIADALEVAHESGVVHRDLKPENVMLVDQPDGTERVKVLDFGVSRVQMADDMPSLTKTGAVFGTPHYMSPEQAGGERVDSRADLYGLGSVLYEMLTGRPVFDGDRSVHVMAAHLKDDPRAPSRCIEWAQVPPALDRLVLDLLEKEPEQRPQSATDVRGRIEIVRRKLGSDRSDRSDDSGAIEVDAPTETWLGRAGDTTRRFYRVVDDRLPVRLGIGRLSGETLAVVTMVGFSVILLLGVAGLYVTETVYGSLVDRSPEQTQLALFDERRDFERRTRRVSEAMEEFRDGSPAAAASELAEVEEDRPTNPHLQFLLGRTLAAAGDWNEAMDHYERAVRQQPEYTADPALLEDALFALGLSDEDLYRRAANLLKLRIDRPEVRERLARAAWHADSSTRRRRAHAILEEAEVLDRLPAWQRHAIGLRRASGCSEHRQHIERLGELGAAESLEVLRIYDRKPRSGCGTFGKKDCYGCVRADLDRAIERLESEATDG